MEISEIGAAIAKSNIPEKLFTKGETVQARILSIDSATDFVLKVKNEVFHAVLRIAENTGTPKITENLTLKVAKTSPEIILEGEDGLTFTIEEKINPQKADSLSTQITGSKTEAQPTLLKPGDVIKGTVIAQKGKATYLIKIGKQTLEASSLAELEPSDKPVSFLIEKVKPQIVLKLIDSGTQIVEFLSKNNAPVRVETENNSPTINKIATLINEIKSDIENGKRKDALIKTQRLLKLIGKIESNLKKQADAPKQSSETTQAKSAENTAKGGHPGKTEAMQLKRATPEKSGGPETPKETANQSDPQTETTKTRGTNKETKPINHTESKTPPSETQKQQTASAKTKNGTAQKTTPPKDGKGEITGSKPATDTAQKEPTNARPQNQNKEALSKLMESVRIISETISRDTHAETKPVSSTDNIPATKNTDNGVMESTIQIKQTTLQLEKQLVENRLNDAKITIKGIESALPKISNGHTQIRDDSFQRSVEAVKNILKQPGTHEINLSLFVQIPVSFNRQRGNIYIQRHVSREREQKRAFTLKLISNTSPLGVFEIHAAYYDGEISCNVGFENKSTLKAFQKKLKELKEQLPRVSIGTFLIKRKPLFVKKGLNIEA